MEFDPTQIFDEISQSVDEAVGELASTEVELIQQTISTPYPPASIPGMPPHLRTGTLEMSVQRSELSEHETEIYADAPYAEYLEFGTSKLAPRPFMGPAEERIDAEIEKVILDRLGK